MLKKFLLIIITSFLFFEIAIAQKIAVFKFTKEEFKDLKVKKVKGETTWSLGSNENGNYIKAEAEGKGSGLR